MIVFLNSSLELPSGSEQASMNQIVMQDFEVRVCHKQCQRRLKNFRHNWLLKVADGVVTAKKTYRLC